jgi:hypothetical protein
MKQGIVMEIQAEQAYVFTNECNLIKVPARKEMFVGQSIPIADAQTRQVQTRRWFVPALAAACVILLASVGLLAAFLLLPHPGLVYLSLDINPSVEFVLDTGRNVTEVIPVNSEAWEVLGQNDLKGLHYEQAIVMWIALVREKMPDRLDQVLISAILSRQDRLFADQIMSLDSTRSGGEIPGLNGLNIKVIYSMNGSVKDDANANNLSYGRQMLLDKARDQNLGLDADYIRTALLPNLLTLLNWNTNGSETSQETTSPATKPSHETAGTTLASETSQTAATTSETGTAAETTLETSSEATHETTKATTHATTAVQAMVLQAVVNSGDGWKLQWSPALETKELAYYKVVISQGATRPKYPDNGYLYALPRADNLCWADNRERYNSGDFEGYLVPGQSYYVSITYVYSDGSKTYSNVLHLTYSGPAAPAPTTTASAAPLSLHLEATGSGDGIHLFWDISPESRTLLYYKVVISQSCSEPSYPDQGYLYALPRETTNCWVDNTSPYNSGDFGEYLAASQTYYIAITYVFADESVSSNVLQLTYNGPAG